ncbi:hypothetical protein [Brevundimonas sp. GCM10030266]|uniref:hypothetical protein n=1 Tax=Brevundimonas sp. GCM10030266 TaxID=3273386 RepID=UPI003608B78F
MRFVQFVGGHGSPVAGKPVFVNADAVGIVFEGAGSKDGRPITAIHCGGFPVLVAGSIQETLAALRRPTT